MPLTIALTIALTWTAPADSVTGRWQITGDVVGNPLNEICTLRQADTVLTGNCVGADAKVWEITGEVKEGKITFRHGGDFEGAPLTIIYTGTLASPTEIRGTLTVQPFDASGEFTAKPAPPAP